MNPKPRNSFALRLAAPGVLLALVAALVPLPALAEADEVGRVSFVIGRVQAVDASGAVRELAVGMPIRAGDTVRTAAGEHAHLRFVDGGFVSVRPGSRLGIEQYDTDPDNTAIRFRLEQGVVRSITGEAAQARKERFRLNTPVAAIGVRGTDFVVQSGLDEARVVVNRGAVVVAPLAGACAQQSLGPCATAEARELTDAMGRVLLELTAMQPPRLRPIGGNGPDQSAPPVPQEPVAERPAVVAMESAGAGRAIALPAQLAPSQEPPVNLRWGRWAGGPRAGDTHSVDYAAASAAGSITVGDRYAGLFRTSGERPVLSTQLGQGSFRLFSGEVSLVSAGVISPGRIEGGRLDIDFAQRRFSTTLALSHALTGKVGLASAGAVRDDGVFAVRQGASRVAGAVSLDGKEVGYLFDRVVDQGTLTGTTLWTR